MCNREGKLFWARRIGQNAWQFPQGGIRTDEEPAEAMYRELSEEVGLRPEQVEVLGHTRGWLRYRLPRRLVRYGSKPLCIGQKQVWFMLRFLADDNEVRFDLSERPEFDSWRWVDYWSPVHQVVHFKRAVYSRVLQEFAPLLGLEAQRSQFRSHRNIRR